MHKPHLFALLALALSVSLAACSEKKSDDNAPGAIFESPVLAQAPAIRNVSVEEASVLLQSEAPLTVIDVRTAEEFAQGHIKGAINLDALSEDFEEQLAALAKDKPYLVHCRSGRRSAAALETMRKAKFTNVAHMDKGLLAWNEAGLPTQQP